MRVHASYSVYTVVSDLSLMSPPFLWLLNAAQAKTALFVFLLKSRLIRGAPLRFHDCPYVHPLFKGRLRPDDRLVWGQPLYDTPKQFWGPLRGGVNQSRLRRPLMLIRLHTHTHSLCHTPTESLIRRPAIRHPKHRTNSSVNSPPPLFAVPDSCLLTPANPHRPSFVPPPNLIKSCSRSSQHSSSWWCLLWSYFETHFTRGDHTGPLVLGWLVYCTGISFFLSSFPSSMIKCLFGRWETGEGRWDGYSLPFKVHQVGCEDFALCNWCGVIAKRGCRRLWVTQGSTHGNFHLSF